MTGEITRFAKASPSRVIVPKNDTTLEQLLGVDRLLFIMEISSVKEYPFMEKNSINIL